MKTREFGKINGGHEDNYITVEEVLDVLKHMKVDDSSGPDQVDSRTRWEAIE